MNFQATKVMTSFPANGVHNIGQFKSEIKNSHLEEDIRSILAQYIRLRNVCRLI